MKENLQKLKNIPKMKIIIFKIKEPKIYFDIFYDYFNFYST